MDIPSHRRPLTPQALKSWLDQQIEEGGRPDILASNIHRGVCASWLDALFVADDAKGKTEKRHLLLQYLVGKPTTKDMTVDQAKALIAWAVRDLVEADQGRASPDLVSCVEAARVIREMAKGDA